MTTNISLPESTDIKSFWSRPEGKTGMIVLAGIVGSVLYFWGLLVPFLVSMLVDTLHMAYLAGILAGGLYLVFGKRPRLMYRVILRKLTSLFVAVYPIEIIEDKLLQMKKRRDKMNEQISLVSGSITKLKRVIDQNKSEATRGFGLASQAKKMAGSAADENQQHAMELQMKGQARKAERRLQSNVGYQTLLDKLTKVYGFLSRYATNIDFFIDDTQDEINQKKTEYETTQTAFGAMKQAMAVIKGNATEEDIYDQAFQYIEDSVSKQLGIMDDLQRVSQNFMDGMDVQTGAVDDHALQALNAFEQKLLTSGDKDFTMVTQDKKAIPVPVTSSIDFSDLLK